MTDTTGAGETSAPTPRKRRGVWRAVASALLITLGSLLAPVALVATASQSIVRDTDTFVEALAPLAADLAIQGVVVDQVVVAIDDAIDTRAMVRGVITGMQSLEMPAAVSDRLPLLEGPAVAGIQSIIRDVVTNVVKSPAFVDAWRGSLRLIHAGANAAIEGTEGSVLVMRGNTVAIDLAPIITAVQTQLIDQGFTIARVIPAGIGGEIFLAEVEGLTQVRLLVQLLDLVSVWLPLVAAVLVLAGVWVARNSRRAAFGAGLGLFLAGVVPAVGLTVGRAFAMAFGAEMLPKDATAALFDAASGQFSGGFVALALVGTLTALGAWWSGPSPTAVRARALVYAVFARLRLPAPLQSLGQTLRARSALFVWVLLLAGAAVLIAVRPFTPALVVLVAAIVLALALIATVLHAAAGGSKNIEEGVADDVVAEAETIELVTQ